MMWAAVGPSCIRLRAFTLQRQFLALRRAGALPLQAWLERRGLGSCALPTHRELPFVYNWGVLRTPLFYQIKSLCNCTSLLLSPSFLSQNFPQHSLDCLRLHKKG